MEIYVLCITIFFCRVLDVSLGTVRTIFTVNGKKFIAGLIGFLEVLVWFLVVREALNTDEKSIFVALSYSAGYATGTIIGGFLAKLMIPTTVIVQVITTNRNEKNIANIREHGYPITVAEVYGSDCKTERYMLFIQVDGKKFKNLKKAILDDDPNAFISVSEAKQSINGYFASSSTRRK